MRLSELKYDQYEKSERVSEGNDIMCEEMTEAGTLAAQSLSGVTDTVFV